MALRGTVTALSTVVLTEQTAVLRTREGLARQVEDLQDPKRVLFICEKTSELYSVCLRNCSPHSRIVDELQHNKSKRS
jgi:hypothetical protein